MKTKVAKKEYKTLRGRWEKVLRENGLKPVGPTPWWILTGEPVECAPWCMCPVCKGKK